MSRGGTLQHRSVLHGIDPGGGVLYQLLHNGRDHRHGGPAAF
jgi:hypothetical protein